VDRQPLIDETQTSPTTPKKSARVVTTTVQKDDIASRKPKSNVGGKSARTEYKFEKIEKVEVAPEYESLVEEFVGYAWENRLDELKAATPKIQDLKLINALNCRGQSALYCACRNGNNRVIVELLNNEKIDVNVKAHPHGGTPLHVAAANGKTEAVALLLTSNATVTIKNSAGEIASDGASPNVLSVFELFNEGMMVRNCESLVSEFAILKELKYTQIVLKKVELVKQKVLLKQQEEEREKQEREEADGIASQPGFQFAAKKNIEKIKIDYSRLNNSDLDDHIINLNLSKQSYAFASDFSDVNNFLNYFNNPSYAAQNNPTITDLTEKVEMTSTEVDKNIFDKIDKLIFNSGKEINPTRDSQFSQKGVLESLGLNPLFFSGSAFVVEEKEEDKSVGLFQPQKTISTRVK